MNYLYLIILSSLLNINKNTEIFLKIVCLDITFKVYFMLGISYNIFLVSAMFDFVLGSFFFCKVQNQNRDFHGCSQTCASAL